MPGPLLAVDAPSLLYRAFFALPKSITGTGGAPVNALLGTANLVLQAYDAHRPRAVVLCFGAEAAAYRVAGFAGYHADRPPMPAELEPQWHDARAFFAAFGWPSLEAAPAALEADDLLGALAQVESGAGGRALLFTSDRDMYQCVGERVAVLAPAKGGPEVIDAAGVRERYGIEPAQVPDLIALRGDPSDGLPGAKGIGAKGAADLLRRFGDLEGVLAAAGQVTSDLTPRVRGALLDDPDLLRRFRDIATLRPIEVERPPDAPLDAASAAAAASERGMGALTGRLEARAG
jgi:DNA polymerase-1